MDREFVRTPDQYETAVLDALTRRNIHGAISLLAMYAKDHPDRGETVRRDVIDAMRVHIPMHAGDWL